MRRVVLLVAACSGNGAPATTGSAAVTRDAAHADAPKPVDATLDAPGDAAAPIDPSVTARVADPILIAIPTSPGITIARLDKSGLHVVKADRDAGNESFGWVDEHVLVSLGEAGVTRFVDGQRGATVAIAPADATGTSSTLLVTRNGEVWLTACDEYKKDGNTCKRANYLRALPTKGKLTSKRPTGIVKHRTATPFLGHEPWPLPPTSKAQPKIELKIVGFKVGGGRDVKGVSCHSADADEMYPDADGDGSSGFDARATRWVITTPPIYEVTADITDPVDYTDRELLYFRACSPAPLDNFAWLGDGLWAAYEAPEDGNAAEKNGVWTFYVDATPIGTLRGLGALRANR